MPESKLDVSKRRQWNATQKAGFLTRTRGLESRGTDKWRARGAIPRD